MSIWALQDEEKLDPGFEMAQNPATDFSDVFTASMDATARNYLTVSKDLFTGRERGLRDQKYKEMTGRDLYEDAINASPEPEKLRELRSKNLVKTELRDAVDAYLAKSRSEDPEKYKGVYTSAELDGEVKRKAKDSLATQAKAQKGASSRVSFAGSLAGGAVASFADPLNLATLPLGAGLGAGIIKTALIEAGLNAGTELVSHPFVAEWQREVGNEYGFKDLAENMGIAAVFGGVVGGGMKGIEVGIEKIRSKSLAMDELARGFNEIDNPAAAAAATSEARRIHIEEANPAKLGDLDPSIHRQSLEEVDAALNQRRSIDPEKVPLTDAQMRGLDTGKMDPNTAAVHARLVDETPVARAEVVGEPHEIANFDRVEAPNVTRQLELLDLYESPQFKSREKANFSEHVAADDTRVFMDDEMGDMSAADIKKQFDDDEAFLSAISTCGLGGS